MGKRRGGIFFVLVVAIAFLLAIPIMLATSINFTNVQKIDFLGHKSQNNITLVGNNFSLTLSISNLSVTNKNNKSDGLNYNNKSNFFNSDPNMKNIQIPVTSGSSNQKMKNSEINKILFSESKLPFQEKKNQPALRAYPHRK